MGQVSFGFPRKKGQVRDNRPYLFVTKGAKKESLVNVLPVTHVCWSVTCGQEMGGMKGRREGRQGS